MFKIKPLELQERLKYMDYITIPYLQNEYGIDYKKAKNIMNSMIKRAWVLPKADGIRYPIIHTNLGLRNLKYGEIDNIIENITFGSAMLIRHLKEKNGKGSTASEIRKAIEEYGDVRESFDILRNLKLIYTYKNLCYLSVSQVAASIIMDVGYKKARNEAKIENYNVAHDMARYRILFDVLFKKG